MNYLAIFIAGILAALLLYRILAALLRLLGVSVGVLVGGKLVLLADDRLQRPDYLTGAMIGGVVGFVLIGILCAALIYNMFVNARRASAHERVDKEHDSYIRKVFGS